MDDMHETQQPQQMQDTLYVQPTEAPTTPGLAIASLVLGIAALATCLCCYFIAIPLGILAVIFGHLSLSKIKKQPHLYTGRGFSVAGLITGYIGIALSIVLGIVGIIWVLATEHHSY